MYVLSCCKVNFIDTCQTNENEDGFTCIYDYTIDIGDYEIVKLGIGFSTNLNNNLNNYNLSLESKNETTIYTDLNYISGDFNREEFKIYSNYLSILVQSKDTSQNLDYYNWMKAYNNWVINENHTITNMDYLFPYTYKYTINNGTIENNEISQTPNNMYNGSSLSYSRLTLNNNTALYLGMYFIDRVTETRYWVYFTDEVYYTMSNDLIFNTDYNNNQETITTIQAPSNVREEYSNAYTINLSEIEEIIINYRNKKNEWLNLFNSIYEPMPQTIKNILVVGYTILLGYAIFLIFKD